MTTRGALALCFIVFVACSEARRDRSADAQAAQPTDASRSKQKTEPREPAAPARPTFRGDIVPVLQANCAGAHGCHGEQPTRDVDLDLRAENAYEELVGRPAKRRPGAMQIKPGDPDASFMVDKLLGRLGPNEGKAMPLDERTGEVTTMTPSAREFVDRVLRPWIEAGAPME